MRIKTGTGIAAAFAMLLLILDGQTAIAGAQSGLRLCAMNVIPSLFPFLILSILLTSSLAGKTSVFFSPLARMLRIPQGSESLLAVGVLGGYPMGAQAVAQAYSDGRLTRSEARRMLGFCSNAGPAFLFGITGASFSIPGVPCILWGIQLLSALITGLLLPGGSIRSMDPPSKKQTSLTSAMEQAVTVMSRLCGWIILFRVILAFFDRWFLWLFDSFWQVLICGLLELTIGCTSLSVVSNEGLRFILCSLLLSFGGICVTMQTASVTGELGLGMYLPGKLIQTVTSLFLSVPIQWILYREESTPMIPPIVYAFLLIFLILPILLKKTVAIRSHLIYNHKRMIHEG